MTPIGSVYPSALSAAAGRIDAPLPKLNPGQLGSTPGLQPTTEGFGSMLDGLVSTVAEKQAASSEMTRKVLLGESDQMHQSVIAMQEAGVAFSLMVEVRNKLVESYQELMRMQV